MLPKSTEVLVVSDETIRSIIREAQKQKVTPDVFLRYLLKHYKLNFQKDINVERRIIKIEK